MSHENLERRFLETTHELDGVPRGLYGLLSATHMGKVIAHEGSRSHETSGVSGGFGKPFSLPRPFQPPAEFADCEKRRQ